jgi:MFS family permease
VSAPANAATRQGNALGVLFVAVVVDLLGFGMVIPILANYAERFGAQGVVLGLLLSTYSAVQLVFAPLWGKVSDRIGRRPVLVMCALGGAVGYSILGIADSLWLLFVARAVGGACAASMATMQAYIADVTAPEQRTRGMALIGAGFGLGFIFGPAISFLFLHFVGVRAPYFVAASIALLNAGWIVLAIAEPKQHQSHTASRESRLVDILRQPRLAFLLAIFFLVTFGFASLEQTFSLFTHVRLGFEERENAVVFICVGVILTVVQLGFTRRLAASYGEGPLMITGTATVGAGAVLLTLVHTPWDLALPILLIASGNALSSPSLMAAISRSAPPERQGATLGLAQSLSSTGRIFGPLGGTYLFAHVSSAAPYVAAAVLMFTSAMALHFYGRRTPTP